MAHVIEVFIADHCPTCPPAYEAVVRFAASRQDIRVVRRNFEQDQAIAARYHLFATPAVVIDGRSVLYGVPRQEQLAARCDRTG
ncbi:MAG: thioredoxin family protein [Vicinamibacteraceae bacterium]